MKILQNSETPETSNLKSVSGVSENHHFSYVFIRFSEIPKLLKPEFAFRSFGISENPYFIDLFYRFSEIPKLSKPDFTFRSLGISEKRKNKSMK